MLDQRTVFEIHRYHDEGYSIRKIARLLGISRSAVKKYLENPTQTYNRKARGSKLDPHKDRIAAYLQADPNASAVVIRQRLAAKGYEGGITILRDYIRGVRKKYQQEEQQRRRAYLRFESGPGDSCQVDWGHFDSLPYGNTNRKVYCLALVECHSRLMFVEFTHRMTLENFLSGLLHGFVYFGGCPRRLVHDNLRSAVTERLGKIIRFNERYLEFLRPFHIEPVACTPFRPYEKGKVEKGGIHYIRNNFWPLRSFRDLEDLNAQARRWLREVANVRVHSTTGERPIDRFRHDRMQPLPPALPDVRETAQAKVHRDFRIRFDSNYYTVPPWAVGKKVTAKADSRTVTVYHKARKIAAHRRSWERKKVIENSRHVQAALKSLKKEMRSRQVEVFVSLGEPAEDYLNGLARAGRPLMKDLNRLLALEDRFGAEALRRALEAAMKYDAYGADYVENILHQQQAPRPVAGTVVTRNEELNRLRLTEPDLQKYDAVILKQRGNGNHE